MRSVPAAAPAGAGSCRRDPVQVLGAQPLFAALGPQELTDLARRSACRTVPPDTSLFREGEPCRGLYLVLEGAVNVYRSNRDGEVQTLRLAEAGDSLGEVSLFDEGPYLASALTVRASHLLFLPVAEVQALYARHPEVAHAVVADMGRRLRGMIALVDRLSLQDVASRVAGVLEGYAEQAEGGLRPGVSFRLPRTQEQIAAEVGATRESVARALRRLREAGAIRQRGRRVEIVDPAALRIWGSR